jgi:hypothetical protein
MAVTNDRPERLSVKSLKTLKTLPITDCLSKTKNPRAAAAGAPHPQQPQTP